MHLSAIAPGWPPLPGVAHAQDRVVTALLVSTRTPRVLETAVITMRLVFNRTSKRYKTKGAAAAALATASSSGPIKMASQQGSVQD